VERGRLRENWFVDQRDLSRTLKSFALEAGFDLCGIAPVCDFLELARFPEWIAAGRAGEMKYLESRDEAGNLRRVSLIPAHPRQIL